MRAAGGSSARGETMDYLSSREEEGLDGHKPGWGEAQKDYEDGQISTVLLVTDGRNDDPKGGLSLSELKKKLRDAVDPKRPVDISTLAIGEDVNTKELSDIAKITGSGGTVYTAKTPQDVSAVLAASLQNRSSN